ncbi:MAG: VanZ family protein [Bacteroidota bacterium]
MQSNSFSTRLYKLLETKTVQYVYVPLVLYWITLFTITTIPQHFVQKLFELQDKIEHFLAYTVLAILLNLSLHFQKKISKLSYNSALFTFLLITVYAGLDEIHQIIVPGRYADFFDWVADSLGGLSGVYIAVTFIKNAKK